MDSRLSPGLRFWLSLPGWRLLAAQWLGIGALALLGGGWLLQQEWRQRESAAERQQRLSQQIALAQRQLDAAPAALSPPPVSSAGAGDLASVLQRAGGALLRWQRQEKPARQTLSLRIDYVGLLALLATLPADMRLEQLSVETQTQGMTAQLILRDATEEAAND